MFKSRNLALTGVVIILFIFLLLNLTACASSSTDAATTKASVSAKASLPEPPTQKPVVHMSLAGDWTAKGSNDDGGMAATVDDTGIVISWTGKNVSALYWKGTFPMSAENETVTSKGDVKAMESSLMAESINPNYKQFVIKDGKILFTVSMQGVTQKITLEKD